MDLEFVQVVANLLFLSCDDAAIDALSRVQETQYEVGGAILRDSRGWYSYTAPQGGTRTGKVFVGVQIPQGSTYACMYHTHPGNSEGFSPQDVRVANKRNVISYVRTIQTGSVIRYTPGQSPTYSFTMPGTRIPTGEASKGTRIARIEK